MSCRRSKLPTSVASVNGIICTLVLLCAVIASVSSLSPLYDEEDRPIDTGSNIADRQALSVDGGEYGNMRTQDGERRENMKKLLLLALMKMAREQKTADQLRAMGDASESDQLAEQKRGRWQGFCFRKSRSGRIHPYICWKGSDI